MPPDGYRTSTVSEEVFQQVIAVMIEYECERYWTQHSIPSQ
jgi:hypothetical protein